MYRQVVYRVFYCFHFILPLVLIAVTHKAVKRHREGKCLCSTCALSLSMFNIDDKSNEKKIAGRHIDVVYSPRRLQRLSPDPFTFSSLMFMFIFLASFNQSSGWVGGRRGSGLRAVLCGSVLHIGAKLTSHWLPSAPFVTQLVPHQDKRVSFPVVLLGRVWRGRCGRTEMIIRKKC